MTPSENTPVDPRIPKEIDPKLRQAYLGVVFWGGFIGAIGYLAGGWVVAIVAGLGAAVTAWGCEWLIATGLRKTIPGFYRRLFLTDRDIAEIVAKDPGADPPTIPQWPIVNVPLVFWLWGLWIQFVFLSPAGIALLWVSSWTNPEMFQAVGWTVLDWNFDPFGILGRAHSYYYELAIRGYQDSLRDVTLYTQALVVPVLYFVARSFVSNWFYFTWLYRQLHAVDLPFKPRDGKKVHIFWILLIISSITFLTFYVIEINVEYYITQVDGHIGRFIHRLLIMYNGPVMFYFCFIIIISRQFAEISARLKRVGPYGSMNRDDDEN